MTGKFAESQFKNWKKEEVEDLAEKLGVSKEGTKKDIVQRICEVEVEVPDTEELTPEEVREIKAAEVEAEARQQAEEAEKENAGKVGVRCIERFHDLECKLIREEGEEWDTGKERAEYLEKRKLVEMM